MKKETFLETLHKADIFWFERYVRLTSEHSNFTADRVVTVGKSYKIYTLKIITEAHRKTEKHSS